MPIDVLRGSKENEIIHKLKPNLNALQLHVIIDCNTILRAKIPCAREYQPLVYIPEERRRMCWAP